MNTALRQTYVIQWKATYCSHAAVWCIVSIYFIWNLKFSIFFILPIFPSITIFCFLVQVNSGCKNSTTKITFWSCYVFPSNKQQLKIMFILSRWRWTDELGLQFTTFFPEFFSRFTNFHWLESCTFVCSLFQKPLAVLRSNNRLCCRACAQVYDSHLDVLEVVLGFQDL